jgi:superfamily II DNA/RNA helicase
LSNNYYSSRRSNSSSYQRGSYHSAPSSSRSRGGPKKENINPSRFISAAREVDIAPYIATHSFDDFEINKMLKTNIEAKGFVTPSPIQDQAIPVGLEGKDIIGVANTGTGKTIAFAIPLLNKLITDQHSKALIIAPTRELANQISAELRLLSRNCGIRDAILIGGSSMSYQLRDLRQKPRVVIGTPGRIKDHIERKTLDIANFNIVVLDEVDQMLDMGFVGDMRTILGLMPVQRQSFFFTATLDNKVNDLIRDFAKEPITISVKTGNTTDTVEQNVVIYGSYGQKVDKLHDLLNSNEVSKVLVFDDTQRSVEKLSNELVLRGFKADAIHGGKSQGHRQRALNKFKASEISILVATDVAARGIDVSDISHVINYSTPKSYNDYVHRIGRTGRAGKRGYALTFIEK